MTKGKIAKWGNSLALRIPQSVAEEMGIRENSAVYLAVEDNRLLVKRQLTLDEMLETVTPDSVHRDGLDYDPPRGKEEI